MHGRCPNQDQETPRGGGGGGGDSKYVWVGVFRWDLETLNQSQIQFSCILQPYAKLKTKIPTLFQTRYFPETRSLLQSSQTKSFKRTTTSKTVF